VKKKLTHIRLVDERQVTFGVRLGLDFAGCTLNVAAARIEDCIQSEFHEQTLLQATKKQTALAAKFGYNIATSTRRVAHAVIADIMEQLDREAIIAEGLAPGVTVTNIHDKHSAHYVISSVQSDLLVYFKGGNGRKAYARSLRRVAVNLNDSPGPSASAIISKIVTTNHGTGSAVPAPRPPHARRRCA
jgi:hypothetical protein